MDDYSTEILSIKSCLWFDVFSYVLMNKTELIDLMDLKLHSKTVGIEIYKLESKTICFVRLDYENMNIIREIALLQYMGQRNISRMNHINITKNKKYIYYLQSTQKHTLLNHIIDITEIEKIMNDLGAAICYLHHINVVHENITLDNVLIQSQTASLINFNRCKKIIPHKPLIESKFDLTYNPMLSKKDFLRNEITSIQMPPEILTNKSCSVKVDIWMYGCIMLYLLTGKHLCDIVLDHISKKSFSLNHDPSSKAYYHPYTKKMISSDTVQKYLEIIQNKSMIDDLVNVIFNDTDSILNQFTISRQGLYKTLIRLSLHPNPIKRLSSKAIRNSLKISFEQIYRGPYWIFKKHQRRRQNGYKGNYVIEYDNINYIQIIRDLVTNKKLFILERNHCLTDDDIITNLDSLWDMFESTPDSKHLHNMTVLLFTEFAFRTSSLDSDNIWYYLIGCKFLTHNLYHNLIGLVKFMKIENERCDMDVMRALITDILTTLQFDPFNEYIW